MDCPSEHPYHRSKLMDLARTTPSIRPDVGVPRRRRNRTVYSNEALAKMEELFAETAYPDIDQRETLSATIGVPEARLQTMRFEKNNLHITVHHLHHHHHEKDTVQSVWFQNRRSRGNGKRRDRKLSSQDSSTKNNKRTCAERSDEDSDTSTEDWFVGVCQPPTKVQRLEQDVVEKISLIKDTNSQICDSTPYCYLPAYLPLPYYFPSVIGHAQCGLLATNPTPNSYCKMPAPVSPSPYCYLSPTMSYGRDLQCTSTVGVPHGYTSSPIDYNCSTPTWTSARSGDQKTMMCVPPMRHATRHTIAELSGAECRGDDDDSGEDSRLSFVDSSASDCS